MLKINVLTAATAAALFAVGGAVAQTSTSGSTSAAPSFSAIDKNNDGQISRQEWSEYERTARPAAGVRSDKQPTATTGPRDVGGSDKAKNPGSAAGTAGSSAGGTGAAAGSTGAASSTDKAPTAATGPKEAGGTDKSMSSGSSAGSTSSGATTGSTSADKKDAERGPTAPTGEPKVGGSKSN